MGAPRRSAAPAKRAKARDATPAAFSGRYATAGPYHDGEGYYDVRLERVPGGVRLAEWDGSGLRRRAPVLATADLAALIAGAAEVLAEPDAARLAAALEVAAEPEAAPAQEAALAQEIGPEQQAPAEPATVGVSRGRSGDFKEELRVEPLGEGRLRVARWVLRPGAGWQLQEAPPMLPAARYAEALANAARSGALAVASDAGDAARL